MDIVNLGVAHDVRLLYCSDITETKVTRAWSLDLQKADNRQPALFFCLYAFARLFNGGPWLRRHLRVCRLPFAPVDQLQSHAPATSILVDGGRVSKLPQKESHVMNNSLNLVICSQSGQQFDAVTSLGSVRDVFDEIALGAAIQTAGEDNLVSVLARASASEMEYRIDAVNELVKEGDDVDVSDAVWLAVDGLRFSFVQLGAIALVADLDVANRARDGAALISTELLDAASSWARA
jgi:hypothetical protein